LSEPEPRRGVALDVLPGIRRVVAANPGPLTYHGTNTYLVDQPDGVLVLDPGPDLQEHVDAILQQAGGPIVRIGTTHGHTDHVGAMAALARETGAVTFGFAPSVDDAFRPDVSLRDGDTFAGLTAVFTPGHAPDHLCYAFGDGVLFTGDHVMGWSSTFIGAPAGNMRDYLDNLQRLLGRSDRVYLSAHGPALHDPQVFVKELIAGRMKRERQILAFVRDQGQCSTAEALAAVYPKAKAPRTQRAAQRTLLAHLIKLRDESLVDGDGEEWHAASAAS
jgi:glyoxylase-like metal-dependent hydrolase (beta-lactamase superfamily II)